MVNLLSLLASCEELAAEKVRQSYTLKSQRGLLYKSFRLFFRVLSYGKGGEFMTPIDLFKAGVTFGVSIYVYVKKTVAEK